MWTFYSYKHLIGLQFLAAICGACLKEWCTKNCLQDPWCSQAANYIYFALSIYLCIISTVSYHKNKAKQNKKWITASTFTIIFNQQSALFVCLFSSLFF